MKTKPPARSTSIFALAMIVAASVLLCAHWVLRTPFFEQPDENAHADYAFSIYTAGRLLRARDGRIGWDVHPYTKYLEAVSNFRGIRFNEDGRVPPAYGTRGFYQGVDAGKPPADPKVLAKPGAPVPYVAAAYSFVFYGLEALALAAVSTFTGGSLTAMFFAMRFLCVLFMAVAIIFWYATLRELHVDRVRALALTGSVALFPLTLWHAAYVQPDNLACAAVSASLYATLRIRNYGLTLANAIGLGAALGIASATKPTFFACVALVAFLVVVTSKWRGGPILRRLLLWSALIVPSVTLLALSGYFSNSADFADLLPTSGSSSITGTFPARALALVSSMARASWSTFGFGQTSAGIWHGFSWLDDSVLFGSFQVTFVIHALIVAATLATVALMCRRQTAVYQRLLAVARRRSWWQAFALLARDPVLNSYLLYAALMISLDALTYRFISSNRYWVAFLTPAFLCGVWYAPRSLDRQRGRTLSTLTLALLISFSLLSIPYSWKALTHRFYDAVPAGHVHVEQTAAFWPARAAATVARGVPLDVAGWAFDSTVGLPARGVVVVVDNTKRIEARYGLPERAFSRRMHDGAIERSGFSAQIPTSDLALGTHSATICTESRSGKKLYPTEAVLTFTVSPAL